MCQGWNLPLKPVLKSHQAYEVPVSLVLAFVRGGSDFNLKCKISIYSYPFLAGIYEGKNFPPPVPGRLSYKNR